MRGFGLELVEDLGHQLEDFFCSGLAVSIC